MNYQWSTTARGRVTKMLLTAKSSDDTRLLSRLAEVAGGGEPCVVSLKRPDGVESELDIEVLITPDGAK